MQELPSMEVESMYDQAHKYLVGERVRRDTTRGLQLLREAANRGHPGAAWDLNSCRHLAGMNGDSSSSRSFYEDDDGRCVIDWQRALNAYRAHAAHNHPVALTNLARCYRYARGVPKDMKRSVRYLQQAADLGYSLAQNGLAVCYENGWGVDADFNKALELYKKAADGGYYRALYNMGVCHENGEGVPRDSAKAIEMFEKAASLGYYAALVTLGDCYMEGKGKEQNKQKAVELYTQAAEQGDPEGLFSLAGCYLHGMGVEMDIAKALDLYSQSGKQGHASALIRLGYLYQFGMAEPGGEHQGQKLERDLRKAFECYKQCALTGDNMGIQLLYHLLNNDFVEKSEQGYVTSSLFQMCCGKVNRMLEEQILDKIEEQQQQHDQEELHDVRIPSNDDGRRQSVSSTCEKSEFEKQVVMRLPTEVRERLHTEKRLCERIGCKRAFYGEGCMRRTHYQRAPRPARARAAEAATDDEGQQTITPMTPVAAAPEAEEAATANEGQHTGTPMTREAEQGDERRPPAAASTKVAVQGEPVYLCFCSKECWAAFPETFEEAMRNAM